MTGKKTLFRKLIITYISVMVITLALIAVFFSNFFYRYFINSEEEELVARGTNLSQMLSQHMSTRTDQIAIEYLINSLEQVWNIKFWVTDSKGVVFAVSRGMFDESGIQRGMMIDNEDLKAIHEGGATVETGYTRYLGVSAISIGIPVNSPDNGEFLGALFLSKPVVNIYEVNSNMIRFLLLAAILSVFPTILIAFYLSRSISRPLSQMNRTAMAMAAGNYRMRVNVGANDEIGQLGTSLNDLSGELDSTVTELQNEKGKLELILTSLSEGILAVDSDKKIIHYNRAVMELLDIRVLTPDLIISGANSGCGWLAKMIDRVIANKSIEEVDYRTGKGLTVHAIVSPITGEAEDVIGAVALVRDISEAAKLEQLRKDYVANISHELRTPLTAVRGFIEPLIDGTVDDPEVADRYHKIIFRETLRLQRLISELLDLSRLQAGSAQIELEPMNVEGVIENVLAKFKPQGEKKAILIEYAKGKPLPQVMGNEDRIEQMLIILIDNAITFTQEGGKVAIWAEADDKPDGMLKISVTDNGSGMSQEDLKHIWERFYKADKSRGSSKGTGLGLSIAKHIAELMGGTISAESVPGDGSTFTFTLRKADSADKGGKTIFM